MTFFLPTELKNILPGTKFLERTKFYIDAVAQLPYFYAQIEISLLYKDKDEYERNKDFVDYCNAAELDRNLSRWR